MVLIALLLVGGGITAAVAFGRGTWLLALASSLSLLLCAATTVLWVRSYSRFDQIGYHVIYSGPTYQLWRGVGVTNAQGTAYIHCARVFPDPEPLPAPTEHVWYFEPAKRHDLTDYSLIRLHPTAGRSPGARKRRQPTTCGTAIGGRRRSP